MDLNSNADFPSNIQTDGLIQLKREQVRNSQRKEDIQNKLLQKRQQYIYQYEQLYLKQQELRKEELALVFNKSIEQVNDHFYLNEVTAALEIMVNLESKLENITDIPEQLCVSSFTNVLNQLVAQLSSNNQLEFYLLTLSFDSINISLFPQEQSVMSDYYSKTLELLKKEKHRHAQHFLTKLYQNNPFWFEAVLFQEFLQINKKLFELLLKHIENQTVWIILSQLKFVPYDNLIFSTILKNISKKNAFLLLRKTLCQEEYQIKYIQANIFYLFTQVLQQSDDKQYFLNEVIDCILSICCLKFELFEKVITSGLALVISAQSIKDFTVEGVQNLQRIVYWMCSSKSELLSKNIKEGIWFQNIFLILLQQQLNHVVQINTLDILKQQFKSDLGCHFKEFFRTTYQVPDNIQILIERYL
ncbi:unnamed protein product [Paramecium primaurelia]|uniref:Uncharacterized protein n=1 Tax=Paramecium primaurelia TaxID=5886 RepID=A0A8S1MEA6_PARPR|nr:unnamed protein product [Paramecium primaurelia]